MKKSSALKVRKVVNALSFLSIIALGFILVIEKVLGVFITELVFTGGMIQCIFVFSILITVLKGLETLLFCIEGNDKATVNLGLQTILWSVVVIIALCLM